MIYLLVWPTGQEIHDWAALSQHRSLIPYRYSSGWEEGELLSAQRSTDHVPTENATNDNVITSAYCLKSDR